MSWSKGPWKWLRRDESSGTILIGRHGCIVAAVEDYADEESQDNALLIAAAPELAEMVRQLLRYIGATTPDMGKRAQTVADAEALLARIRSESEGGGGCG